MPDHKTPIALPPQKCVEFLSWLLKNHREPTTLIICCSRESFLADLRANLQQTRTGTPSATPYDVGNLSPVHSLLIPTIHLISKTRSTHIVFVPTLAHLRAYLSTYTPPLNPNPSSSNSAKSGSLTPILAVWGLVNAHRSTAEHSAQGLSRTLAAATESAAQAEQILVLAEPKITDIGAQHSVDEAFDETSEDLWKEQVPLLSGSVRFGGENRTWAGKTIEVARIVAKWCRLMKLSNGDHGV